MKKLTLIAALLLAGCGSGGDNAPTPAPPAPAPAVDAFFATVSAVVAAAPDQSEPANIDTMAASAPEDSDPSPL